MTNLSQGNLCQIAPVDPHRTFQLSRSHLRDEASERTHERRLTAAGGTTHESEGTRMGRQVDPTQSVNTVSRQLADIGKSQGLNINHGRTPR